MSCLRSRLLGCKGEGILQLFGPATTETETTIQETEGIVNAIYKQHFGLADQEIDLEMQVLILQLLTTDECIPPKALQSL